MRDARRGGYGGGMTAPDRVEIEDFAAQAHAFLAKARDYLAEGDLHQTSEKGWGGAAHMAKAAAVAQGWSYNSHADFSVILNNVIRRTGDTRLRRLRSVANELHANFYRRAIHLDATVIGQDLDDVGELIDLLAPLTGD